MSAAALIVFPSATFIPQSFITARQSTLAQNELAERGPIRVYVRIKDPNGVILLNNSSTDFTMNGETMTASASREVDYEGDDLEVSIYVKEMSDLGKGIYTVEAYTEKTSLGRGELMLR